jgi:hypothetical protein
MSIPQARPALIEQRPLLPITLAITLAWAAVCALLVVTSPHLGAGRFPDVDDALRMVEVRDLLAGQGWYDLHQHRMTPPQGTLMHWSRLVDAPLAAAIWLLARVMPQASAEAVVAAAMPLLVLLGAMLAAGRLAYDKFGVQVAVLAVLAFALVPMLPAQFQPLRIDHHAWQVLSVAVATWAVFRPDPVRGGLIAGLAMAAGLMISLETLVMAAGFALLLTWRWLADPRCGQGLARYLQALALGLAGLFAATRGVADLAPHCDAIAPAHLGFFAVVAAGASLLAARARLHPLAVLAGLGMSGLAGLALIGWAAPQCLASPFAGLDPLVRDHWYRHVAEGLPLWQQPLAEALPAAMQCLFAFAIALYAGLRGAASQRGWWREYALLLAVGMAAGLVTYRSIAFAGLLATIPLGWFAAAMIGRWQTSPRLMPKLAAAAALYAALLPAALTGLLLPREALSGDAPAASLAFSACELHRNAAKLDALPTGTLFAPLDMGGHLLLDTRHSVVASSHHRAADGMRAVIAGFIAPPDQARAEVLASGADYLALCTDSGEIAVYRAAGGESSLAAMLARGDAPAWLEPVTLGTPPALRVWRVADPD